MPAVTVIGNANVAHCSDHVMAEGSPNVFVGGIPVTRKNDKTTVHLLPGAPCPSHNAPITIGSTKVFVNNRGVGRIGDSITGCTEIAEGNSVKVFAGG